MTYIASQILLWIIVATIFGFALGWLLHSRRSTQKRPKFKNRKF